MTPTSQSSAMTDEEIVEFLATKVMGWEKDCETIKKTIGECECCGKGGTEKTESHFFWRKKKIIEFLGDKVYLPYFCPLTDWNHTMQIVKRMQSLGFFYEISNGVHSEPAYCRFWNREKLRDETVYGEQQLAICLAAIKVLRSFPSCL